MSKNYFNNDYNLIETKYHIIFFDKNNNRIKPSDISLIYDLNILCKIDNFESNERIYSIANIYKNQFHFCIEYTKISEHTKFGVKIYKIGEAKDKIEFYDITFFTDKLFIIFLSFEYPFKHSM